LFGVLADIAAVIVLVLPGQSAFSFAFLAQVDQVLIESYLGEMLCLR